MNQTGKVFLACALGALIGSMVALQLGSFWLVGVLVGGLTGYMTYEFKQVVSAVPRAWHAATNWRPDVEPIKTFLLGSLSFALFLLTLFIGVMIISLPETSEARHADFAATTASVFVSISIFCLAFGTVMGYVTRTSTQDRRIVIFILKRFNPISFYLWYVPMSPFYLARLIYREKAEVALALKTLGLFLAKLFRLIHSEVRLLCGVDAALGALVGYHFGNALIGAAVGGALGVVNFELISIRLLKVVPKERSLFA